MKQIMYHLEIFEGPLDLLLHLIEKEKIDIYDIPIALITEQYLDYVSKLRIEDLEIVSDFLVMAATLLEIKSRMLLPMEVSEDGEEIDPRSELVARLLEYKKYRYMASLLRKMENTGASSFYKEATIPREVQRYVPPIDMDELLKDISLDKLNVLLTEIVRRREDRVDQVRSKFGIIKRERISLQDRIRDVLDYARKHGRFTFRHMLRGKTEKTDVVVSFLALLELMKMGKVSINQEKPFSDMDIYVVSDSDGELDLSDVLDE